MFSLQESSIPNLKSSFLYFPWADQELKNCHVLFCSWNCSFVYFVLKNNEKYYDSTTIQYLSHQVKNSIDYTSQLRGAWQASAICCQKLLTREGDATNFLKIQFECQQISILWFSILCKMYKHIFMNSSGKLVIIIVVEKGRDIKFLMWYIAVNLFLKHYLLLMQLQTKPILTHLDQRCFKQHLSDILGSQDKYIT